MINYSIYQMDEVPGSQLQNLASRTQQLINGKTTGKPIGKWENHRKTVENCGLPSGKRLQNYALNHHFQWDISTISDHFQ